MVLEGSIRNKEVRQKLLWLFRSLYNDSTSLLIYSLSKHCKHEFMSKSRVSSLLQYSLKFISWNVSAVQLLFFKSLRNFFFFYFFRTYFGPFLLHHILSYRNCSNIKIFSMINMTFHISNSSTVHIIILYGYSFEWDHNGESLQF